MHFVIQVFQDRVLGQVRCDSETALEFCDWLEENEIVLGKRGAFDFDGRPHPLDLEAIRRKARGYKAGTLQSLMSEVYFEFIADPDERLLTLIKLRWNDHFQVSI